MTGTETDIAEELQTPSQSESEATLTTTSSDYTSTSQTTSEDDASSEASSRETSRPSSPESGNLTVKSVYSLLPEMTIVHRTVHDAIHAVREQQGRAVTRSFFQQQQQVAASKLQCMNQIRKTSTPDLLPKSNAFPRRTRARLEVANGTSSSSEESNSDCEDPKKARFLALKRRFESPSNSDCEGPKCARTHYRTSTSSQK